MKNILSFLFCLLFVLPNNLKADEGMWLPLLLNKNIETMQAKGLHLTADEIYSQSEITDYWIDFGLGIVF